MFSGIVEEIGTINNIHATKGGLLLRISAPSCVAELRKSDSIAVDGVCLTVVDHDKSSFQVEAVEETLKKTSLGVCKPGDYVNLELPLKLNDRLGGHLVLGHIDTVGTIDQIETRESSWTFDIRYPEQFSKFIIPVGSVAINGVSLTVAAFRPGVLCVSIIPHTWKHTTFQYLSTESKVNIEFDVLGKYVVSLLEGRSQGNDGREFLTENHLKVLGY